ncbi:MAG: VWA domain-containing protein [Bacteroidota bacterium]
MENFFRIDFFDFPEALYGLVLLPLYFFWYLWYDLKGKEVIPWSFDPHKVYPSSFIMTFLRHLPTIFYGIAFVCLIIAVARPQSASESEEKILQGRDIILIMDISESMESQDIEPDRISLAKEVAIDLVKNRSQDRVGVVLFSARALKYVPLTTDHAFLEEMIKDVSIKLLPKGATVMGESMAIGIDMLRNLPHQAKLMFLISDGASNQGSIPPISAAKTAAFYQIPIYTLGIGGKLSEEVTEGEDVAYIAPNLTLLKDISDMSGGVYVDASLKEPARKLIQSMEQRLAETDQFFSFRKIHDQYPAYLVLSLASILLALFVKLGPFQNPLEL